MSQGLVSYPLANSGLEDYPIWERRPDVAFGGATLRFIDELLTVPERESGGQVAIERFDYQTAWGLSKAMKLHAAGRNYAIAFEFHDDIVELDDISDPQKAIFYQVKTRKSGNWTFSRIVERGKKRSAPDNASFAGRMFDHVRRFKNGVDKLVFVSNQPCPTLGTDYDEFPFGLASSEAIAEFVAALKLEDALFDEAHVALFHFCHSDLNLGSFDKALLGEIMEFVREQGCLEECNVRAFALMLNDECRRRSRRLADLADFAALKDSKFLSRQDMDGWLAELKAKNERRVEWSEVAFRIENPATARAIKAEWVRYEVERRTRIALPALKFQRAVKEIIGTVILGARPLLDEVEIAMPMVRRVSGQWATDASDNYLRAVILYEFFDVD